MNNEFNLDESPSFVSEDDSDYIEDDSSSTKKKGGLSGGFVAIILAIGVLVIIAIVFISGMSIDRKEPDPTSGPTASEGTDTAASGTEGDADNGDPEGGSQGVDKSQDASDGGSDSKPNDNLIAEGDKSTPKPQSSVGDVTGERVQDPSLEGQYKGTGFVMDKYTVKAASGQFVYVFELRLTNSKGNATTVYYYPVRGAYDSVAIGNTLDVTYTGTSEGNISITSVSKG